MIPASALILLADATTTSCALPGSARLGGRAVVVRPVGTFEAVPFVRLGPAIGIPSNRDAVHQTGAAAEANDEPGADRPAQQCKAAAFPIA